MRLKLLFSGYTDGLLLFKKKKREKKANLLEIENRGQKHSCCSTIQYKDYIIACKLQKDGSPVAIHLIIPFR